MVTTVYTNEVTDLYNKCVEMEGGTSPDFNLPCDVEHGYNFNQSSGDIRVGHLLEITYGGNAITADTQIPDPTNPDNKITALGPLAHFRWSGNPTHPAFVAATVSPEALSLIRTANMTIKNGAEVEVKLTVYEPENNNAYYPHVNTEQVLKMKIVDNTKVVIDPDLNKNVQRPKNHVIAFLAIAEGEQNVATATSSSAKLSKQIGVNSGKNT